MTAVSALVSGAAEVSQVLLAMALLASLVRLILGPSLPDRVMALDLVAVTVAGIIAVDAVATGDAAYVRVAVVIALVAFVGTAAWAVYSGRKGSA